MEKSRFGVIMGWEKYRLYRLRDRGTRGEPIGPEVPTRFTFKARNQKEAEKKAKKLSRDGDFQLGVIIVKNDEPIKNRLDILDF